MSAPTRTSARWNARFGLRFLLLLMVPLGGAAYWLAPWFNDQPIEWIEFSEERLQEELAAGNQVVVFAGADWDTTAAVNLNVAFGRKARHLINRKNVVPLYMDTSSQQSFPLAKTLVPNQQDLYTVYCAVYAPYSRDRPAFFNGLFTEEDLVAALKAKK